MVALIIISLLTFFCVNAVEPPSIYQRNDQNETTGESIKSPKILTYGVNLGANDEKYFLVLLKFWQLLSLTTPFELILRNIRR